MLKAEEYEYVYPQHDESPAEQVEGEGMYEVQECGHEGQVPCLSYGMLFCDKGLVLNANFQTCGVEVEKKYWIY